MANLTITIEWDKMSFILYLLRIDHWIAESFDAKAK